MNKSTILILCFVILLVGIVSAECDYKGIYNTGKISGDFTITQSKSTITGFNITNANILYPDLSTSVDIQNNSNADLTDDFVYTSNEITIVTGTNLLYINYTFTNSTDATNKTYGCDSYRIIAPDSNSSSFINGVLIFAFFVSLLLVMIVGGLSAYKDAQAGKDASMKIIGVLLTAVLFVAVIVSMLASYFI